MDHQVLCSLPWYTIGLPHGWFVMTIFLIHSLYLLPFVSKGPTNLKQDYKNEEEHKYQRESLPKIVSVAVSCFSSAAECISSCWVHWHRLSQMVPRNASCCSLSKASQPRTSSSAPSNRPSGSNTCNKWSSSNAPYSGRLLLGWCLSQLLQTSSITWGSLTLLYNRILKYKVEILENTKSL